MIKIHLMLINRPIIQTTMVAYYARIMCGKVWLDVLLFRWAWVSHCHAYRWDASRGHRQHGGSRTGVCPTRIATAWITSRCSITWHGVLLLVQ